MKKFLLRRLAGAVFSSVGVITIVFFLIHLIPGDPVELMLGEQAASVRTEELRTSLHLNESIGAQYVHYIKNLVSLDLGSSIVSGETVTHRVLLRVPFTIFLSVSATVVALLLSIPVGTLSAFRKNSSWDFFFSTVSLFGLSIPAFWLGPLLLWIFAYRLNLFPISGADHISSVVLPACTLGVGMASLLTRMVRSILIDVLREPFVRTARAKGVSPFAFWKNHAFRNALSPILTIVGLQFGALLAGSVITESIFNWPGIGLELVESIHRRDYPVVQGIILLISITYVLTNLFTDLLCGWIDPRTRRESLP